MSEKCDSGKYSASFMWTPMISQYPIVPLHMGGASHLHTWAAHESRGPGSEDRSLSITRTRPVADVERMPFWKVFHIRYVDTHALPALYSAPTHGWCFTSSYWAAHESYRPGSEDRSSLSPRAGPFQAFGKCDSRRYSTSLMWPPLLSKHPIVPLHMGGALHLHTWAAHVSHRPGSADRRLSITRNTSRC